MKILKLCSNRILTDIKYCRINERKMRSRQRFEAIPPGGVGIYPPGKSVLSGREAPYALVHVLGAVEDKVDFTVGIGLRLVAGLQMAQHQVDRQLGVLAGVLIER